MEELNFRHEFRDVLRGYQLHGRSSVYRGFAMALCGAGLVCFRAISESNVYLFALAAILLVAYFPLCRALTYVTARKAFRKGFFGTEVVFRFNEDSFQQTTLQGEGTVRWLVKALSTDDIILYYIGYRVFLVLPRRVCTDEEQFARLKRLGERLTAARPQDSTAKNTIDQTERNA